MNLNPKYLILLILIVAFKLSSGQSLKKIAHEKMKTLENLISEVEKQDKDALKERMTLRTAEVFLKYANWDEKNIDKNTSYFKFVKIYKKNAVKMATDLPDFERNDVIKMLDEAIDNLILLKNGDIVRKPIPNINWRKVSLSDDKLVFKKRPVFLADYTWKPNTKELTEFYGDLNGFYLSPSQIVDEKGTMGKGVINDLNNKVDDTPGFVFIANKSVPDWTFEKYGSDFSSIKGAPFHNYDIDHPGAREMMSFLLKGTVPKMAGKKYTQLGYMLCNEPRWITYKEIGKKTWYNGGVSHYTIQKFKIWLKSRHTSIADLNLLWGSDFADFNDVKIDIPIDISLLGTPKWYDWVTFNNERVIDWFQFMKAEICKYDSAAKVHMKIMPSFFSDNKACSGIDLEALTELSGIIGNDVAAKNNSLRGETPWDKYYALDWRELYMSYDFMKSIRPNQIIFNTESHLLTTSKSRDLYQNPAYARAVFWAAHTIGLSASQIWYWPRREDGSIKKHDMGAYAGSNNQQARVTNEVHSTMMDLNSFSEEILAMQRQRKPIRIFYSKTAATNKLSYMDDVFDLYESLNFEGVSLGFATQNIIEKQNSNLWDVVAVYKTESVTQAELEALQAYLDNGGTVIVDNQSLRKNEYGQELPKLNQSRGRLVVADSLADMNLKILTVVEENKHLPELRISEENTGGHKACTWKCIKNSEGNNVLSVINLGKSDATLTIELKNAKKGIVCTDLLKGIPVSANPILKPYEVYFVEIEDK